jgi:cytochrome c oxidase assembly protein subunit 11
MDAAQASAEWRRCTRRRWRLAGLLLTTLAAMAAVALWAGRAAHRQDSGPVNTQVDTHRKVKVAFVALAGSPFDFDAPAEPVEVHPGELTTVMFGFHNRLGHAVVAQAVPQYTPRRAAAFFEKLECFCFQEQTFQPGERKRLPVVFVVDRGLPGDIRAITLTYTLFEVVGAAPHAASRAPALPR